MSPPVFFSTLILLFGTLIALCAIMGLASVLRARANGAGVNALTAIQASLTDIDARLAAVERLLKEV